MNNQVVIITKKNFGETQKLKTGIQLMSEFQFYRKQAFSNNVISFFHMTDEWNNIPLIYRLKNYFTCTALHCN